MAEYLRQTSFTDVPRFAPAAHRPARRRLYESESSNVIVRMMIGDAIGDAFGFGIEMQDAHWIRKAIKRFDQWPDNPVLDPRHRENNVRGFYSDDAEMTGACMPGGRTGGAATSLTARPAAAADAPASGIAPR